MADGHNPARGVRRARTGRWLTVAAVVLGVAVIGLGAYWFFTRGQGVQLTSPAGSDVIAFTGEGDLTTERFQVREGWQIQWEHEASHFAFAIRGDRDFGTVIDNQEPGSGVTSPVGAGSFWLEITADGSWEIQIVQGE